MKGGSTIVRKYNFTYHDLAYRVRMNMLNALKPYDVNFNGLFEEPQIVQALVNILNQDQNQIRYVISNVFRYDRDGDRAVTYEEFVNFAVEQHFGEMAIQRLHRNGLYSRGRQRLMNFDEFQITLNESLKHVNSQGSTQQYQYLFKQVDLDKDGWIKYEQFFMFLRQYFGSLSEAANSPIPQPSPQPVPQPHSQRPKVDFAQQRFARLIYSQLKITVMEHDLNKSLNLKREQVGSLLQNIFHVSSQENSELVSLIMGSQSIIGYEKFMKVMVPFYFCEYDVHKNGINRTSEDDFVETVRKACSLVRVRPSESVLREIFSNADVQHKNYLQKKEYINVLGLILENYQFDTRGTGVAF